MNKKPFWIPFITAIGTMVILYLIGYLFHITFLQWFYFEETSSGGFTSGGSLNPILIGIMVGFIAELIYKKAKRGKTNLV